MPHRCDALCRTRPSRYRGPFPLVPRAASPAESIHPTARNNKEQTPNIPVTMGSGQRYWRRPVVTHDLITGRCRRSRRDERQRRSPPGPLPAAINHRRPSVCTNSVRSKTFKRYKTHLKSDLVPHKTFSRYQIPIMTKITASARRH